MTDDQNTSSAFVPSAPELAEPITRAQWDAMWRVLEEAKTLSLGQFSALCDLINAEWKRQYPRAKFNNARYASYIEDAFRRGVAISADVLSTLTPDDIRYDEHAFPHLAARLGITVKVYR